MNGLQGQLVLSVIIHSVFLCFMQAWYYLTIEAEVKHQMHLITHFLTYLLFT